MMYAATPADTIIRATLIPTSVPTSSRVSPHVKRSAEDPGSSLRCELTLSLGSSFTRSSSNSGGSDSTLCGLSSARIVQYGWLVG
jgi:hypothetical protein